MSFTESVRAIVKANENGLMGTHASWCRVPLGGIATVLNGFAFPSANFTTRDGMPLLRIRDIANLTTEACYKGEFDPAYCVETGELVVGMDGDFNCALWKGPRALLNQRVCKITTDGPFYSLKFLSYALPGYLRAINLATSSVTVKHLSSRTLEEIPLPLAPRGEQDRIVAEIEKQFTRLDNAVAALKRVQANLKRYRASVLKAACEGRLVPTEAELARKEGRSYESGEQLLTRILKERRAKWEADQLAESSAAGKAAYGQDWKGRYLEPRSVDPARLPELPAGWSWTNLQQLKLFSLYGPRFSSSSYCPDGVIVLRTTDISEWGSVDASSAPRLRLSEQELAGYQLLRHDLVFTRTGATVGKVAVFDDDIQAIPGAFLIQYRLAAPPETVWYTYYFFKSIPGQNALIRGAAGVGRPNLNAPRIEATPIPLPPVAEQARIVRKVKELLTAVGKRQEEVAVAHRKVDRLRQSILQRAFSGKLVPQDPNDEPAAVLLERIRAERAVTGQADVSQRARAARRGSAAAE